MYPYNNPGLFSRGLSLTKGINWSNFLDGTRNLNTFKNKKSCKPL